MKDRLSESKKEQLIKEWKEQWMSTHKLLEKLSYEISHQFRGEKNAWVYQESVKKLLRLKSRIQNKEQLDTLQQELQNLSHHLSEKQKKDFHDAIEWAKEILKNSHDLIDEIKDEFNIFHPENGSFTTKIFWQDRIHRWQNPQNFSDQIIGWWIWLFNSSEAIANISIKLIIWIWKSIPDTYKILSGKAKTNAFKNI